MDQTHLEERVAHLIRAVDELSDVVARQDRMIAALASRSLGAPVHPNIPWFQVDIDMGERHGMAQWDEFGCFLGGHDAGDPGNPKDIALFMSTIHNQGQRIRLHGDAAPGHGHAAGGGLGADIDHMGLAPAVKVG